VIPARRYVALAFGLALAACGGPKSNMAKPFSPANPFANASTLLYQAPPFDKIHNDDYQPALEEGMRVQIAEVAKIAEDSAAPTFENTIVALEKSGAMLTRASNVFQAVTQANTNDTLQQLQAVIAPKLAAHSDAVHMNAALFARIRTLHDQRASLGLDSVQTFLVERYYKDFVRAGAQLSDEDKARLSALNEEESKLCADFQNRLLGATKAGGVVVSDKSALAGMSDAEISEVAEAARARGLDGKWVLPLQNTTQQPYQASLADRATREKLFHASTTRAELDDSNDTRALILRLAQLRAERARILGFPNIAAYVIDDQMAKTPDRAADRHGPCRHGQSRSRGDGDPGDRRPGKGRVQNRAVGLAVLRGGGAESAVRAGRHTAQAVLRTRPRAPRRGVLCGARAVRPDVQREKGYSGISSGRARV
jgi:peptidyl-dipeptidase Dcp